MHAVSTSWQGQHRAIGCAVCRSAAAPTASSTCRLRTQGRTAGKTGTADASGAHLEREAIPPLLVQLHHKYPRLRLQRLPPHGDAHAGRAVAVVPPKPLPQDLGCRGQRCMHVLRGPAASQMAPASGSCCQHSSSMHPLHAVPKLTLDVDHALQDGSIDAAPPGLGAGGDGSGGTARACPGRLLLFQWWRRAGRRSIRSGGWLQHAQLLGCAAHWRRRGRFARRRAASNPAPLHGRPAPASCSSAELCSDAARRHTA